MGKLAQDLKEGLLHMLESAKCCRTAKGNEDWEEPQLESAEHLTVQDRAIKIKAAKGPTRPSVPKGPPPQTS